MTDREFEDIFRKHAGMAYGLALGATGDPSAAEDAVQEAFMYLWRKGAGERADDLRAYLASAVINAARRGRRGEARRRAREESAPAGLSVPAGSAPVGVAESAETYRAVRAALLDLPEDRRLPVLLHVVQDFSQRDVARVLELPASTVSHRINQGLNELRAALARAGFAALAGPALAAALKAGWEIPVPAGLAAAAKAIVSSTAPAGAAGAAASGALKGGLIVKIGLGVAALGLVAGGAFWAVGGRSGEPAKSPPAAAPENGRKFATPVWHPDARWELDPEPFAACGEPGNLDGPRREIMWRRGFWPWGEDYRLCMQRGMPMHFLGYDEKSERYHVVSRGARGHLDGPLSRARWGGESYVSYSDIVASPDRRYLVATDPTNGGALRIVDLKEQMIRTLLPPGSGAQGLDMDSKGHCLVLKRDGVLLTINVATGEKVKEMRLKAEHGLSLGEGKGLALDKKHNWLYASGSIVRDGEGKEGWHVWRFDLNDGGTFHGVLKGEKTGPSPGYAGPFDGFKGYGAMQIRFGPDDPEFRFLYARNTDTGTFQRLDLERKIVAAFSGAGRDNKPPAMFVEEGTPNRTLSHAGPGWLPDGSIIMPGLRSGSSRIYRRVK